MAAVSNEKTDIDSAGVYFMSVEEFEAREPSDRNEPSDREAEGAANQRKGSRPADRDAGSIAQRGADPP